MEVPNVIMLAYLNCWLSLLTHRKLSMICGCTTHSFSPSNVSKQVFLAFDEAVIGELPSVWINLAEPLQ